MIPGFIDIESNEQKLVLESKLKSVTSLDAILIKLKQEFNITERHYNDIWVVLNEAVSNAIIHGNRFSNDKMVRISYDLKEKHYLSFIIKDEGNGFDPDKIPDPTSPERLNHPNGRGVYIMKRLADKVIYTNNGTEVEVRFDLYKN
jgi:serine/threonine-protein kinase RsbW